MRTYTGIESTLALLGCLAAAILCGCSSSLFEGAEEDLRSVVFEYGGGEPGAGSVEVELQSDGRLIYRRIPDYAGNWDIKPVERMLELDPQRVDRIFERLRTLRLERLRSEEIGCCDQIVSQFSARTNTGSIDVQLPGMPCTSLSARPKEWLSAWEEICPLLDLAEPEYWEVRGCPCGRSRGESALVRASPLATFCSNSQHA